MMKNSISKKCSKQQSGKMNDFDFYQLNAIRYLILRYFALMGIVS